MILVTIGIFAAISIWVYLYSSMRGGVSVANRAILITGCDSGFGLAMAMYCKQTLNMVVIACCHNKNGREGSDLLEREGCHVIRGFDVTDITSIERGRARVDALLEEEGLQGLWCVVNNAAALVCGESEWQTPAQIQLQLQVNLAGPLLISKAFLPLLRRSKGRIINMTSASARNPVPCFGVYSASKAGLEALSDCLRLELQKFEVDVVLLEPPNAPEKTPLCSRQSKYHQEMRAGLRTENDKLFGDYFRKSSKVICSMLPAPEKSLLRDETFFEVFKAALSDQRPHVMYKAKPEGLDDVVRNLALQFVIPQSYKDLWRMEMVPLPKYSTEP